MNIRTGFERLSKVFLALCWIGFMVNALVDPITWVQFWEGFAYMLVFTGGYMVACKTIAWVYKGFADK